MSHQVATLLCKDEKETLEHGYAAFNDVQHLCVDVPNGPSTITIKTNEGHKVTFGFESHSFDGPPKLIGIRHHHDGIHLVNGDYKLPIQNVTVGGPVTDAFVTGPYLTVSTLRRGRIPTQVVLSLTPLHESLQKYIDKASS